MINEIRSTSIPCSSLRRLAGIATLLMSASVFVALLVSPSETPAVMWGARLSFSRNVEKFKDRMAARVLGTVLFFSHYNIIRFIYCYWIREVAGEDRMSQVKMWPRRYYFLKNTTFNFLGCKSLLWIKTCTRVIEMSEQGVVWRHARSVAMQTLTAQSIAWSGVQVFYTPFSTA